MKKLLTIVFALTCATSIFAYYDCKINGIYYTLDETNKIAKVTYKEQEKPTYSGSIVIPNTITYHKQSYSVTTIGIDAFFDCDGLTSVTIPNSVTTIEGQAFRDCNGLTSITIPNSVTTIGNYAFSYCTSLTSVTIPYSVTTIGSAAFWNCSRLTSITIPNSVTTIGSSTFSGCSSLKSVMIPNSVTMIGSGAFENCSSLKSVTIPNSVTTIEGQAFRDCNGLTSITIPNSVTTIGENTFSGCKNLTSITIPNSVTTIGERAFYNCTNLKSITIPNSVTTIGEYAFYSCKGLTTITIPKSITTIERGVFMYCFGLSSIIIPNSVTTIETQAFYNCSELKSIIIPKSVKWIKKEAFSSPFLKEVTILSHDIFIDSDAFDFDRINDFYCGQSINLYRENEIKNVYRLTNHELILLAPFSVYAQEYVEEKVNEWQKKGDFEKVADWQKRVNETTRKQKTNEFLKEAQKKYLSAYASKNRLFTLGAYDTENEVYLVKEKDLGDLLVPIPINEAQYVRQNWASCKTSPKYDIQGTEVVVTSVDFTFPNKKTYTYKPSQNLTYAQTDIQYNFDPIELNLGSNTSSTQPKGQQTIQQKQLTIGKSEVDTNIPQTGKSCPNTFAVIISNENYTQLKHVPCAINDGKVFAQYCEKTIGLPKDNIKLYTNATYGMMIEAIRTMKNIATAYNGDIDIIFYYSGHGAPTDDTKEAYLLPVDAFGVAPEVCYSLNKLYKEFADMKAKSVTMFLDACFSGATKDGDMLASVRGVAIKAKANAPTGNMVVFSAASDEQTALPYLDMGHGMFTYYLLKKLQETKGDVTYQALSDYVKQEVYRRSSVVGKVQTPTVSAGITADGWQNWKLK